LESESLDYTGNRIISITDLATTGIITISAYLLLAHIFGISIAERLGNYISRTISKMKG